MYIILVCDDNTLLVTKKERIMQRSKLVDNLQFYVPQLYNNIDMSDYTVQLEYVLPCSKKYCTEILTRSDGTYKEHLIYSLPLDTNLTAEAGKLELQLTFAKVNLKEDGSSEQSVRKTSTVEIEIVPISAWSDIIPDDALSAIDQRLIKIDAQVRALDEMNQMIASEKADNLKYDENTNELQLLSYGREIGDKVTLKGAGAVDEDGLPVVDIENPSEDDDSGEGFPIIDFTESSEKDDDDFEIIEL